MNIQILNRDLTTYGVIGDFESLNFTQSFRTKGRFEIEINNNKSAAKYLQLDKIVYIDEYRIGYVDKITLDDRSNGTGKVRIAEGYELKDRIDRLIYPAAGNVPDSYTSTNVETIIKTLIKKNAGVDAAAARQISNLSIKTDQQRGSSINYSAWRKDLTSEIYNLLAIDKMGLTCELDFINSKITYDVKIGTDKTAAPDKVGGVILSVKENTALSLTDTDDRLSYKNLSVTAGAGTPEGREVLEVGTTATGYDRREVATDARDALNTDDLTTAGNLKLAEFQKTRAIKVEFNSYGGQKLNESFYLGDIVTAESEGEFFDAQVTKVISKYSGTNNIPQIDLVIGFDLDDIIMVETKARRMDYDSLVAAGSVKNVVAGIVVDEDTGTIVIDNLDIKADGNVYDIIIAGRTDVTAGVRIFANDDTLATNYNTQFRAEYGTTEVIALYNYPTIGAMTDVQAVIMCTIIRDPISGHFNAISNNPSSTGTGTPIILRTCSVISDTTFTNITKLTILMASGAQFLEGTTVLITKRK